MEIYYILSLSIFVCLLSSCGKAPTKKIPSQKNKPPIIQNTSPEKGDKNTGTNLVDADEFSKAFSKTVHQPDTKKVKGQIDDGSKFFKLGQFVKNRFKNQEFQTFTPLATSLASTVVSPSKYSWLPNWDFSGKGGVRLPAAEISKDNSLIAILENVTSPNKKISTVLVLINAYNFNINAIHYFHEKSLSSLKFIPNSSKIIVWEKKQPDENSGFLHLINLKTGKFYLSTKSINAASANFAITNNGEKLILKANSKKSKLYLFDIKNFDQMPKTISCNQKEGQTVITPDDSLFALIGKKEIEIFKFSDNMKLKNIPLNLTSPPDAAIFIDKNMFAMLSYKHPLNLLVDNSLKQLTPSAGGKLFFRDDVKAIVFEEYKNKAISIIDLQSLKKIDSFSPEKLKPKTKGNALLLAYLPQHKKYLVLDNQGNMSLFYRPGKRWRKRLIFSPER